MKEILLTLDKIALVDDEDFAYLNQFKWHVTLNKGKYYARRFFWRDGKPSKIYMHREILNTPKGMKTDHKNDNGLDNQRQNLRVCTHAENIRNQRIHNMAKTSVFKGVHWLKRDRRWQSRIMVNYKHISLGTFDAEIQAAKAYDKAAIKYFGEFANLNFGEIAA